MGDGWTTIGVMDSAGLQHGWWHVVWCLDCGGPEVPFTSQEARSAWMGEHREGTGHDRWRLVSARKDAP